MSSENEHVNVNPDEQDTIARAMRTWLNTCPHKPCKIGYEYLSSLGMAMATLQSAYYTKRYIDGSYEAQYVFRLVYRLTTSTDDERLSADEKLNQIGSWIMTTTPPTIAENIRVRKFQRNIPALINRYDDGAEDHAIEITMTYEVNV